MARVKRGVTTHARHKKILKLAKGYVGGRRKTYRQARETVERGLTYAYRDRKLKKRDLRSLWIVRINAAAREKHYLIIGPWDHPGTRTPAKEVGGLTFGDASLLDKSRVIWGSPMADPNIHNHRRCPLALFGHANGTLKGGVHVKAEDGTPMANAMLTILHDLGLDDMKSFGDSTGTMDLNQVQTTAV